MKQYQFPSRQLVSQQDSAVIENANVPRATFKNRWTRKSAYNAGLLYPILVDEILPGDHMTYDVTAYLRMATPLFPMFDGQRIDTHFFFVPYRILWTNWVKLMGEQNDPGDSINYTVPYITLNAGTNTVGKIYDHMGIPPNPAIAGYSVSALPFRAYNIIYNQWFRDENVANSLPIATGDGPDPHTIYELIYRNKQKDYFTTTLPWPQKNGSTTAGGVVAPLSGLANVSGIGVANQTWISGSQTVYETGGANTYSWYKGPIDATGVNNNVFVQGASVNNLPTIYANLATGTAGIMINQLRNAFMVQALFERDARGGTRYTEKIWAHFGVRNPDFRLQRPEYIGGGSSDLVITPVAQTAPTSGVPLGALGGAGTTAGQHRASYAATEHGVIIGLISIRTELSYQQGMHRMWRRFTQQEFYFPALAMLGEQPVYNYEIWMDGTGIDLQTFGYQERWQEYRTRYSDVTGIMRSTAAGTLDAWHLAQNFTTRPQLNNTFIWDQPPMARILAAGALANGQQYLADILFRRTAVRPIPAYGTPATLGRF